METLDIKNRGWDHTDLLSYHAPDTISETDWQSYLGLQLQLSLSC